MNITDKVWTIGTLGIIASTFIDNCSAYRLIFSVILIGIMTIPLAIGDGEK